MSPSDYDQIGRIAKLAVLSAIFTSIVADDVDADPQIARVSIVGDITPDGMELSYQLADKAGRPIGDVLL